MPLSGHTLEGVLNPVHELNARAGDEVSHRTRDENLAGLSQRGDPCPGGDSDPRDLRADDLALPRMDSRSDVEIKLVSAGDDAVGTHNGASRTIESAEETVAGRVDLDASAGRELTANGSVVFLQHATPRSVSQCGRTLCGGDEIGKEHRREHTIG